MKKRVTGFGGVFSKTRDPEGMKAWYNKHLDLEAGEYGDMFKWRVENLEDLLKTLKEEGVEISGEMETYPYGKFGWILDPEGNKIELWEPADEATL